MATQTTEKQGYFSGWTLKGRAFLGDGLATIVAGFGGGTGVTTYAETIPAYSCR